MPYAPSEYVAEFLKRHPPREVLRVFRSAVHPDDLDEVVRLFEEEVRPSFETMDGCKSIELSMDTGVSATGLIEGSVLTRWESLAQMEAGVSSEVASQSQTNIRRLLRTQPVVTVHLVIA